MTGVARASVDAVIDAARTVELKRGDPVWCPSDKADTVYWVRSGVVRVERGADDVHPLILRFHGRRDLFGVAALYSGRSRGTTALAHEECVVFGVPVGQIERLVHDEGRLGLRLSDLLIERQHRLEGRLAGLIHQPISDRLLALFVDVARDFGIRDGERVIVDLRLTHKQMAAMVGATRETVSLALQRLKRGGWVTTEERRFILLKPREMGVKVKPRRGRRL